MKKFEYMLLCFMPAMIAFLVYAFTIKAMAAVPDQGQKAAIIYMDDEHITSSEDFITEVTFRPSDKVPMDPELQIFLNEQCELAGVDYAFALGIIEHESSFRQKATHTNEDGSVDRGIMQVNSINIKKLKKLGYIKNKEDLFNPYINIECGLAILYPYIEKFGNSEQAYVAYNTGKLTVKSNRNSRKVMEYWNNWKSILMEEENEDSGCL